MGFSPELKAEIKRRNPYATDEQIAWLEQEWAKRYGDKSAPGIDWGKTAAETGGSLGVKEGMEAAGAGDYFPVVSGAYKGYKLSQNENMTDEQRAAQAKKAAGMTVADVFTGGLASLGRAAGMRTGFGRKMDRLADKTLEKSGEYDAEGVAKKMGVPGKYAAFANIISPDVPSIAAKVGLLGQQSTKAKQQQRASELMKLGVTGYGDFYGKTQADTMLFDEAFKELIKDRIRTDLAPDFVGMDEKTGRFVNNPLAAVSRATPQDLAKLARAEDVWGSYGMFNTFGNDWLGKYTEDQRRKISEALLKAELLKPDKGDIVILDPQKALAIRDEILGGPQGEPAFGEAVAETPKEESKEEEEKKPKINTTPGVI